MESYKVNFIHKQMYKVYNYMNYVNYFTHKLQIGYVETDKIHYIFQNYCMPVNLLNSILTKNVATINIFDYQYEIKKVVPKIDRNADITYDILVKDICKRDNFYISDEYLEDSLEEYNRTMRMEWSEMLSRIRRYRGLTGQIEIENEPNMDDFNERLKRHMGQFIKEQEEKKCEETK